MKAPLRRRRQGFTLIEVVLAIAVGLLIIAAVSVGYSYSKRAAVSDNQKTNLQPIQKSVKNSLSSMPQHTTSTLPIVCTQEAMRCPDGSYVGRTGQKCEFTRCPSASGIVQGTMSIGPICPVEQAGHPCNPTPQMYAAHQVFVYASDRSKKIATLTPDAQGNFTITLPIGMYLVDVKHQPVGSVQGAPAMVTVLKGKIKTITINIDTGIR